ncbi:MAG: hypothetical protein MZU95_11065 [Desulfomicrobium escambiense]|nr:hypothetical protein [Desulfomicrobium escambiense]
MWPVPGHPARGDLRHRPGSWPSCPSPSSRPGRRRARSTRRKASWLLRETAVNQTATAAAFRALRESRQRAKPTAAFFGFGDPLFKGAAAPAGAASRSWKPGRGVLQVEQALDYGSHGRAARNARRDPRHREGARRGPRARTSASAPRPPAPRP